MVDRKEILHPPLAEAAFGCAAVPGGLVAPEQAQLPLPAGGKLLPEPLPGAVNI